HQVSCSASHGHNLLPEVCRQSQPKNRFPPFVTALFVTAPFRLPVECRTASFLSQRTRRDGLQRAFRPGKNQTIQINAMKRPLALLIAGLFSVWLIGCAGRVYKDDLVAMIQKGVTAEPQLLAWFGPASGRTLYSDGAQLLTWDFSGG